MRRLGFFALVLCLLVITTACHSGRNCDCEVHRAETTLRIAAAASLEQVLEREIIPLFEAEHGGIRVQGTYGGSFYLQTQIEHGLETDLFFSAALSAMTDLEAAGLVQGDTVTPLLENRLVLIAPAGAESTVTGFHDILNAETIAIGDPATVPAGRYAEEVFTHLGIRDAVQERASFGTSVSAVLQWVATGNADAGVVYATDAALTDDVIIIAEAPPDSLATRIVLPVGMVTATEHESAARLFLDFLQTPEVLAIFETYGFTAYSQGRG